MTCKTKASLLSAISLLSVCVGAPASAQDDTDVQKDRQTQSSEPPEQSNENEIVVIAERVRNQVKTPQPPIIVLDEEDIAAYGASSIADLVDELAPETSSGRGRGSGPPVFLVNGLRVSSFREMRSYPPEAIRRVEVLPEEVALKYGFSADQRVINFILKDNFTSREVEAEYGQPDRGGYSKKEGELTFLKIDGPSRLNLHLDWNDTSMLTEAERGVRQTAGSLSDLSTDPDPAAYRTLVPDSANIELTGNWTTKLGKNGSSLSLNGTVERADTRSLSGLNTVTLTDPNGESLRRTYGELDPLARSSRTTTYSLGSTFNAPVGGWQLTATVDASHANTDTKIDRYADNSALIAAAASGQLAIDAALPQTADGGYDEAHSTTDSATSLLTVMGSPFDLPAGTASMTFNTGYAWNRINSSDTRNPGVETSLTRGDISAGINLGIPIASRREDAWAWLGDFNLNFSAGVDRVSDFGTLTNWTAGAVWGLTDKLNLQASYIARDTAPSLSQLSSPQVQTLNVPVYDFTRGETVLVTTTGGGNPDLAKQKQRDIRIAAMWTLPFFSRSSLMVEYFRNHSEDVATSFPLLTPAIEAAFPDRVVRDASGRLLSIDQRPITVAEENASRLKFGLNLGGQFGKAPPRGGQRGMAGVFGGAGEGGPPMGPPPAGDRAGGPPPGGPPMGGRGGGPGGFGGGDGKGRWSLNLSYTVELTNTALVAPGLPVLDLLNGDALTAGGVSRNSIQLEGGVFYRGLGVRLAGTYTGASTVNGTGLPGSSDLRFGSLTKMDLRIFANFAQMKAVKDKIPFLDGARLSLKINNIFDARQTVTDQNGIVPISYQPFLLDPTGRYIGIEFRKLF